MTDYATSLGKDIHDQGLAMIEYQAQTFGDPKVALWRKTAVSKLLLDFAGIGRGEDFTPRVHAALKLGEIAVAILGAKEPGAVIADAMATLVTLAPVEELHGEMEQEQEQPASGARLPRASQLGEDAVRQSFGFGANQDAAIHGEAA